MKFLQANIINISLSGIIAILNMLLSIVEARILGPSGVGNYQIFVSTQTIITTIFALGLGNAGIYFINSKRTTPKEFISLVLKADLFLSLVVFIILFLIVLLNESYFGNISFLTLVVYCIGSSATLFLTALTPVLLAKFQIYKYQLITFFNSAFSIIAILLIFYLIGQLYVENLLIISGVCKLIAVFSLFYFVRKDFDIYIALSLKKLMPFLKFGVQFSMTNVAYIFILNIPIYAISFMNVDGYANIGFYTRAVSICTIAMFVNKQIGPLFFSKLSSVSDNNKIAHTKLMATFFIIFNIIVIAIIDTFANYIVILLYGTQFIDAVPLVRILSISILFTGMNELVNNLFSSIGKPRFIFYNLLISMLILIPLIFSLIRLLGLIGVPIAVSCVNALTTILLINSLRSQLPISFSDFFFITPSRIKDCIYNLKLRLINK